LVDAVAMLVRGPKASFLELLTLSVGLYGSAGLVCAALLGWAAAMVMGTIPGGLTSLRDDHALDARVCGFLLAGTLAGATLAVGTAVSHGLFVSSMNSRTLATIASAGMAFVLLLPSVVVFVASWETAARWTQRLLPRPAQLGWTGLVGLSLAALGVLAFVVALSRADWRVLDLGPFASAAVALGLAIGHGWFWYRSDVGRRLLARLPTRILRPALALLVLTSLVAGSRIRESSPSYAAVEEGG
jgi:hypothetical protein